MKTVKIWFNKWFSTAYHIINLIKKDEDTDFYIIGSSSNSDSIVKEACDEWYSEPENVTEEEYIKFCLDFCTKHNIDIFAPRHNQLMISKYRKSFEDINVKLLVDNIDKISRLQNKAEAYKFIKNKHIGNVPDYYAVENAGDFKKAYEELSLKYERLCYKFTSDEGGCSFRIIDNAPAEPFGRRGNHTSAETIIHDMQSIKKCPEIMLMPLLTGNEVSVDCLKTQHGDIMIPRFKTNTRVEYIKYDDEILSTCSRFLEKMPLEYPCNIQFRYLNDIPYFLEINTRMSGGIQLSCLASGVNIPNLAVNKLLGVSKPWNMNRENMKVSHIETPILLK